MIGVLFQNGIEVRYEGPATLAGSGRAHLHDRVGGISEMVWEALDGTAWVGEITSHLTTVALRIGVAVAPATGSRQPARFEPLPGRARRVRQKGRVDQHGVAWQGSLDR